MAETVLVTGGTGYIAGWTIVELLKRGYSVRTTVRNLSKEASVRAAVATEVDAGDRLSFAVADLTSDAGWDEAVTGCTYVLHVASPLGGKETGDLIAPARDGALRALAASVKAGVKRVVLTSSVAASSPRLSGPDSVNDESVWTDPADKPTHPYRISKTLAERAAWEFMKGKQTELVTILPSAVFGPVLTAEGLGSVQVISRLMTGKMPGIPNLGFTVVDVRDVAAAHILAMTSDKAAGERFITAAGWMWMADLAAVLKAGLGAKAAKVPTRRAPNALLRIAALFDPAVRLVIPSLGKKHTYLSEKAQKLLGWKPRPVEHTVVECARSLIDKGAV